MVHRDPYKVYVSPGFFPMFLPSQFLWVFSPEPRLTLQQEHVFWTFRCRDFPRFCPVPTYCLRDGLDKRPDIFSPSFNGKFHGITSGLTNFWMLHDEKSRQNYGISLFHPTPEYLGFPPGFCAGVSLGLGITPRFPASRQESFRLFTRDPQNPGVSSRLSWRFTPFLGSLG